jgi:hypothetical protein
MLQKLGFNYKKFGESPIFIAGESTFVKQLTRINGLYAKRNF